MGIYNYLNSSFAASVQAFNSVVEVHPGDRTAEFFLSNAKDFMKNGTPENWTGVLEMRTK
ncbi:MAG: hypothetical protein B7X75_04080 [Sphingobacteriales bacterium 39-40-5]|nr:MAG: hypothetical protein B7X75_04080 [Sphingobacteriales bacterium 39-40-5]